MSPTRRVLASLLVAGLLAAALATTQTPTPQATPEQQHQWNATYAAFPLSLHLTAIAQQDWSVSAPPTTTLLYAGTALAHVQGVRLSEGTDVRLHIVACLAMMKRLCHHRGV